MELDLKGQRVIEESTGYTLSLRTEGGYEIRIENTFSIHASGGVITFSLGETNLDPDMFPSLLDQTVTSSSATDSGVLELAFDSGTSLRVAPHDSYEAWTITGPNGRKAVCMPGGEIAEWGPQNN
jgi:hypothetical protein